MVNTRGIARLGMLAVGLGIGAAVAQTPVASADTSTDWLSSLDSLLTGALPAAAPSGDLAISFDGMSLVTSDTATATTVAGQFGLAIAEGDGAKAVAEGGTGDYALADGTNALANAGDSAAGATGSNFDSAIDIGSNPDPSSIVGFPDGAFAGNGSLIGGTDVGTSSNDTAIDIGSNGVDSGAPLDGGNSGAFAGAGQLIGASGDGNGDTAINFGNLDGFGLGPAAVDGTGNFASDSGNATGDNLGALAGFGNDNTAYVDGGTSSASAGGEYGATTPADLGNNDIAYVIDPSGADGSSANAGFDYMTDVTGNNDLAAVLFADGLTANAVGADGVTTILPALGAEATTGGSFLADLFPSLGESAASSGSNFLTDLLSLF
jgi:hypothetical protein